MTRSSEIFGNLPDGSAVHEVKLKKGRLEAWVLTYGAIIRDLQLDGKTVVLGFDNLDGYLHHSPYFGTIVGRCANRINQGKFELDGKEIQLSTNLQEKHHLHGGYKGLAKSVWEIEQYDENSILLKLDSPDGDEGYPGNVTAYCRYTLTGTGAMRVKLTATTDKPTIINLTQHSYFNLDNSSDINDHNVEISAGQYLPVNDDFIPTGEIRNVEWTPYDFQRGRKIRRKPTEEDIIFDNNFCLADSPREKPEFAASVTGSESDTSLELWTTEPGVQLYDGYKLAVKVPGLNGKMYKTRAGLCLEPQRWPDSPNHPEFAGAILRPDETYTHISEFRFS